MMVYISTPPPSRHVGMVKLPLPPNSTPIVPTLVDSTNSRMLFCQSVSSRNSNVSADYTSTLGNAYVTISTVNGHLING